jgi:hypothetical protein
LWQWEQIITQCGRLVEVIMSTRLPLDELNETALYQLLGEAWCAYFRKGNSLPTSVDIGKREFNAVAPILAEALRQPYFQGVPARIASALEVEATWRMPATVVAALAQRKGMIVAGAGTLQE